MIEELKEKILQETAIPKSAFDIETSGPALSFPVIESRLKELDFGNPAQDAIDSFRMYMQTIEEATAWRRDNERQLSEEEELMDWFIHCKNSVAGNDNPDAQKLRIRNAIFGITRKTIGFDLPSISFDFASLNKLRPKPFSISDMLPPEPIKIDKGVSLKNNISRYALENSDGFPLTVTDLSKTFIMPCIL